MPYTQRSLSIRGFLRAINYHIMVGKFQGHEIMKFNPYRTYIIGWT